MIAYQLAWKFSTDPVVQRVHFLSESYTMDFSQTMTRFTVTFFHRFLDRNLNKETRETHSNGFRLLYNSS